MKKMKILAIALFSAFASTNVNAEISVGGVVTNWNIATGEITCAPSSGICFAIDDNGDLYFPDLGVVLSGYGDPVKISEDTWHIPSK